MVHHPHFVVAARCHRDWFQARSRGYASTLDAALHGNAIPTSVVENLIATTKESVAPLQRYQRLRKQQLGLDEYHLYDGMIPLLGDERPRVRNERPAAGSWG